MGRCGPAFVPFEDHILLKEGFRTILQTVGRREGAEKRPAFQPRQRTTERFSSSHSTSREVQPFSWRFCSFQLLVLSAVPGTPLARGSRKLQLHHRSTTSSKLLLSNHPRAVLSRTFHSSYPATGTEYHMAEVPRMKAALNTDLRPVRRRVASAGQASPRPRETLTVPVYI